MAFEKPAGKSMELKCTVSTTEITGSESFIHLACGDIKFVALTHGVHEVDIGAQVSVYLSQKALFVFDRNEKLVSAPNTDSWG